MAHRVIPTRTFTTLASVPRHSHDSVKAHLRVRALEIMQQDSSVQQLQAMERALVEWNMAAKANIRAGKRMGEEGRKGLEAMIEKEGPESHLGKELQAILDDCAAVAMDRCQVMSMPGEPRKDREVMGEDPECIADGDEITLWDCDCPECKALRV